jgi:hypothetical protein
LPTLNRAELPSSSVRTTLPALQVFVPLEVVAENAECDVCQTIAAEATSPIAALVAPAKRIHVSLGVAEERDTLTFRGYV